MDGKAEDMRLHAALQANTPKPEAVDLDSIEAGVNGALDEGCECETPIPPRGPGGSWARCGACNACLVTMMPALLRTARRVEEAERRYTALVRKVSGVDCEHESTTAPCAACWAEVVVEVREVLNSPSPTPNHGG